MKVYKLKIIKSKIKYLVFNMNKVKEVLWRTAVLHNFKISQVLSTSETETENGTKTLFHIQEMEKAWSNGSIHVYFFPLITKNK